MKQLLITGLLGVLLVTGCTKENVLNPAPGNASQLVANKDAENNFLSDYENLDHQTLWELQQARAATARYRNINNAIADGYADISVVVPNMGHHYMRSVIVDANFEMRKPEILVYNPKEDGGFELVAVEYAVPIALSPNEAPGGFTGTNDVWDRNTGFGLWLLHAWVWHFNPSGVFNPTNPDIHVH
jgi:hypothetical protein